MSRILFIIRDKNTGVFCSSSKLRTFSSDLGDAAIFNQRKNAEAAIRKICSIEDPSVGRLWTVDSETYYNGDLKAYIDSFGEVDQKSVFYSHISYMKNSVKTRLLDLEVVEAKLTLEV